MTYDASDTTQAEKAEDKTQTLINDLTAVLQTESGRRWMWSLLERCRLFQSSFGANAAMTSFNEGIRNIGLQVMAEIMDADPELFTTMMLENQTDV